LKKQINTKSKKIDLKIISDYKAEDLDTLAGKKIVGDKPIQMSGFDLQKLFDYWVRNNLTPFYPEERSVNRVKEAIYRFFEQELKMPMEDFWEEIVKIVLDDKNSQHFINVLDKAKTKYKEEVEKRESELVEVKNWNIPGSLSFGEEYEKLEVQKSIMDPFYIKKNYLGRKNEVAFINLLERSTNVEWWFKNGDRDATFFAVPYNNGEEKPFYVDFIVKMKDGRIGLFDPHGRYLRDFEAKNDGLYRYIQKENKKGKKLFGGIVANTDPREYKGRWVYFDKPSKKLKNDFANNWKDLEL